MFTGYSARKELSFINTNGEGDKIQEPITNRPGAHAGGRLFDLLVRDDDGDHGQILLEGDELKRDVARARAMHLEGSSIPRCWP